MAKLNSLRQAAALVLIGIGLFLYLSKRFGADPNSDAFHLLSDTGGTIGLVVCNVNSAQRAVLRNTDLVNNIINTLDKSTNVVLALNDPDSFSVAENPWPERIKFLTLPSEISMTIWPQDPFVVLQDDEGQNELLLSNVFERAGDREMAIELAKFLRWNYRDSVLSFDGGNIVSDQSTVFIGANTIADNAVKLNDTLENVVLQFEREFGRSVLVLGPVPQPIGHIDMMLTPLGERQVVLADPGWGADFAEDQLSHYPDQVKEFEQHCEKLFFANPQISQLWDVNGDIIKPPELIGLTQQAIVDSRSIAVKLDRLAVQLSNRGYEVFRMPFLFMLTTHEDIEISEAESVKQRAGYPQITYNNVLLEVVDQRRLVYLPQYGWPDLDDAACKAWEELGYEPIRIGDFSTSAMYGGALRCCVKVLERR